MLTEDTETMNQRKNLDQLKKVTSTEEVTKTQEVHLPSFVTRDGGG